MAFEPKVLSKAEARAVLSRVGADPERVEAALADLPDPFDVDAAEPVLGRYGITAGHLIDRLGGSP
jgi:hypothetical protein